MNTPDETARVVWKHVHLLCEEMLDLDARAAREGWGPIGARIADAACEALAHVAAGCGGHYPLATNRLATLTALRASLESLVGVQKFLQTAHRGSHLAPDEARELLDEVKETSGMILALAMIVRSEGPGQPHRYAGDPAPLRTP